MTITWILLLERNLKNLYVSLRIKFLSKFKTKWLILNVHWRKHTIVHKKQRKLFRNFTRIWKLTDEHSNIIFKIFRKSAFFTNSNYKYLLGVDGNLMRSQALPISWTDTNYFLIFCHFNANKKWNKSWNVKNICDLW